MLKDEMWKDEFAVSGGKFGSDDADVLADCSKRGHRLPGKLEYRLLTV